MPLNTKPLSIIAVAAAASLAAMTAAQAGDDVAFSYKSSELESTSGVSGLYSRIETRAETACAARARSLYAKKVAQSCEDNLVNEWVAAIDDSRLNRMHAQNGASQIASVRK